MTSQGGLGRDITHIFPPTNVVLRHNKSRLEVVEASTGHKGRVYSAVDNVIYVDLPVAALRTVLRKARSAPARLEVCDGCRVAMCGNSLKQHGV